MREITPKNLRCTFGSCPALYEVTPADMKCADVSCPALYEQEDGALVVGKILPWPDELKSRIGPTRPSSGSPRAY